MSQSGSTCVAGSGNGLMLFSFPVNMSLPGGATSCDYNRVAPIWQLLTKSMEGLGASNVSMTVWDCQIRRTPDGGMVQNVNITGNYSVSERGG